MEQPSRGPSPAASRRPCVDDWFNLHEIDTESVIWSPAKDWATISLPVSLAESRLGCKSRLPENKLSVLWIIVSLVTLLTDTVLAWFFIYVD